MQGSAHDQRPHGQADAMTAPAYLSRASLAVKLDMAESTVDDMVKRGILPAPVRLSPGCVRWCWADVATAIASLKDAQQAPDSKAGDPYTRGARDVSKISEGRRRAS